MNEQSVIRVALVDDHTVLCAGLKILLEKESDIEVVGHAGSVGEGMHLVLQTNPDVLVLKIHLPDGEGLQLLERVRRSFPKLRVVILTGSPEEEHVWQSLTAGANGYVSKNSECGVLIAAIRSVAHAGTYVDPLIAGSLLRERESRHEPDRDRLSTREQEVLHLLAQGYTAREIATQLCISPKTVETYKGRIRAKTGLSHRHELFDYAVRHGLIEA